MTISEKLTYCTTKIVSTLDNGNKAIGTGFFMNFNIDKEKKTCQPVVLTNKHVISGAKSIEISVCKANEKNKPLDKEKFKIEFNDYSVIKHPDPDVDLCAIPIAAPEKVLLENNIHLSKGTFDRTLIISEKEVNECAAIEDIIMIGYPNGLEDTYNNKPIIRKGITSTHIKNDYNNKKEFLIDMSCFPGSSGSPVFIYNENSYNVNGTIHLGPRLKLVGVLYAGPQYTTTGEITIDYISISPKAIVRIPNNIGVVIKASRILELEEIMKKMQ